MIVDTHKDAAQTLTLSYFSEAETSAAAISTQCAAVRDADLGKPELFGSFFVVSYLRAPVVPRSRYPRNDHNVGGSRLWD